MSLLSQANNIPFGRESPRLDDSPRIAPLSGGIDLPWPSGTGTAASDRPDAPAPQSGPAWLRALGRSSLPDQISLGGRGFRHLQTFKHDFFAATGLYEGPTGRIILKLGRKAPVFGLPMRWVGRLLARHEGRLYRLVQGIDGVPAYLGDWGETGIVHEFVEGRPLPRDADVDDDFFPRLAAILTRIHARGAAYVDLEKRENILLGDDGRPHLIDFQISWYLPANRGGELYPMGLFRRMLQASDRYHLMKHWRRLRPDQVRALGLEERHLPPIWIRVHRWVFRPLTLFRRWILVRLGARSSVRTRSPG